MRSRNEIPHDRISYYPDLLKKAGYHTSNPGKTDYNIGGRPDKECWDLGGGKDYGWRKRKPGQPFFCVVNIGESHESRAHGSVGKTRNDPAKMKLFSYHPDLPVIRQNYANYADAVENMDKAVGQIMQQVKTLGLDENTIVIFASDNGPTYGRVGGADSEFFNSAGPFRGLKGSVYEGGIRVPFIARWQGRIEPNSTSDHLSYFPDLFETFSQFAGAEAISKTDGISMSATLLGEGDQKTHEFLYWEFPSYGGQQAIRYGKWKGVRQGLFKDLSAPLELYDLSVDIAESIDLSAQYPEIVQTLDSLLKASHIPSETFPFDALDNN